MHLLCNQPCCFSCLICLMVYFNIDGHYSILALNIQQIKSNLLINSNPAISHWPLNERARCQHAVRRAHMLHAHSGCARVSHVAWLRWACKVGFFCRGTGSLLDFFFWGGLGPPAPQTAPMNVNLTSHSFLLCNVWINPNTYIVEEFFVLKSWWMPLPVVSTGAGLAFPLGFCMEFLLLTWDGL